MVYLAFWPIMLAKIGLITPNKLGRRPLGIFRNFVRLFAYIIFSLYLCSVKPKQISLWQAFMNSKSSPTEARN